MLSNICDHRGDSLQNQPFGRKYYLRIPPLRKYLGHLRGGILREGGIVNWNTPDSQSKYRYFECPSSGPAESTECQSLGGDLAMFESEGQSAFSVSVPPPECDSVEICCKC